MRPNNGEEHSVDSGVSVLEKVFIEKKEISMCGEKITPRIERIQCMISRLEDIPIVQEHMTSKALEEEEKQIEEMVALVEEKQKVRKMGPIQRFVYDKKKRRKR